jgi:hypothetical protein
MGLSKPSDPHLVGQDIAADIMTAYLGWIVVNVCVMFWAKLKGSTGQANLEQN